MNISKDVYKNTNIRLQTVSGKVSVESLVEYLKELYACPDFDPGQKVVWDFSAADLSSLSLPEVIKVRDFIEGGLDKQKPYRAALVVSGSLEHSLTSMFETLIRSMDTTARVFFDLPTAIKWLEGTLQD
jgi:hypothetical protein